MFEVYFDDSGTHLQSRVAIAACYISTERAWQKFASTWDEIRISEGFDVFHMADFATFHDKTRKPFCDWDVEKRERVYRRIAACINDNKRIGMALSIPQRVFNSVVPTLPDHVRWRVGNYPYTAVLRMVMGLIRRWRTSSGITLPMQYVFDREDDPEKKAEITKMFKTVEDKENWGKWYGIESEDGHSFQSKALFKPLQAADILAWQHNDHMRNVILRGRDDILDCHRHFMMLRDGQAMNLGYLNEAQFRRAIDDLLISAPPAPK